MQIAMTKMPVARTEADLRAMLWAGRVHPPAEEQENLLRALVPQRGGCLVWPGRTRKGRGRVSMTLAGRRVQLDVHRALFALTIGPIAPGHVLSHRCKNMRCANPHHLELLSARTVWERGVAAGRIRPLRGWLEGHGPRRAAA